MINPLFFLAAEEEEENAQCMVLAGSWYPLEDEEEMEDEQEQEYEHEEEEEEWERGILLWQRIFHHKSTRRPAFLSYVIISLMKGSFRKERRERLQQEKENKWEEGNRKGWEEESKEKKRKSE